MPIGTSSGEFYEDRFEYAVNRPRVYITKDDSVVDPSDWTQDQNVVHPDKVETDKQLDRIETDPATGMGIDVSYKGSVDDRREEPNPNSPKWENVIPSVKDLIFKAFVGAPMADEVKPGPLSREAGFDDAKIEKAVPQRSLLDRAIDDTSDGAQFFYNIARAIQGKEPVRLGDDIPFTQKEFSKGITLPTMPLGASTEPAGAFKSPEASQVAPEVDWTRMNQPFGSIKGTSKEDTPVIATAAGGRIRITEGDVAEAQELGGNFAGTMIGIRGKLFDRNALAQAQIMESNAASKDMILKETGMFRGTDNRWRTELDDSNAFINAKWYTPESVSEIFKNHGISLDHSFGPGGAIKNPSLRKWKTEETVDPESLPSNLKELFYSLNEGKVRRKLPEVLEHPELFQAYPELKNFDVVYDPTHKSAHAAFRQKEMVIGPGFKDDIGTFLHEAQHFIQDIEGFAGGGAPMQATKGYRLKYQKDFEALKPELEALLDKADDPKAIWTTKDVGRLKELGHISERYKAYVLEANKQASEYYMRMAGEVEARNVEIRLLLNKTSRRNIHPERTQDYPISDAIVMPYHSNTTAYGVMHPETGHIIKP